MSEHPHKAYRDPTADTAIGSIMLEEKHRFTKRIFICSPFAGDVEQNIEAAKTYCLFAIRRNCAPFAPHLLYPRFLDDRLPRQRDEAIRCGMSFLRACHEVWVFGKKISPGMNRELQLARNLNKPIIRFDADFRPKGGREKC